MTPPPKSHVTSCTRVGTPFVPLLPPSKSHMGGVGAPGGDLEGHVTAPPKGHVISWTWVQTPFVPLPPPSKSHGGVGGHLGVTLRVT